jgi:hypothetical protein
LPPSFLCRWARRATTDHHQRALILRDQRAQLFVLYHQTLRLRPQGHLYTLEHVSPKPPANSKGYHPTDSHELRNTIIRATYYQLSTVMFCRCSRRGRGRSGGLEGATVCSCECYAQLVLILRVARRVDQRVDLGGGGRWLWGL